MGEFVLGAFVNDRQILTSRWYLRAILMLVFCCFVGPTLNVVQLVVHGFPYGASAVADLPLFSQGWPFPYMVREFPESWLFFAANTVIYWCFLWPLWEIWVVVGTESKRQC